MGEGMPTCVGTYEDGHESCDGGGETVIGECALRELCLRFRDWCAEGGLDPGVVADGRSAVDIENVMAGRVEVYPSTPKTAPKKSGKRAAAADRMQRCHHLLAHFELLLRDRYGDARFAGEPSGPRRRVIFKAGTFYRVDRTERSRYVVWYCKADEGHDRALVCVHLRSLTGLVDAQLPFTVAEMGERLSESSVNKLSPIELEDGQFKSVCRGLDAERVGLVVSAIKRFDERGWYPLPKFEG